MKPDWPLIKAFMFNEMYSLPLSLPVNYETNNDIDGHQNHYGDDYNNHIFDI